MPGPSRRAVVSARLTAIDFGVGLADDLNTLGLRDRDLGPLRGFAEVGISAVHHCKIDHAPPTTNCYIESQSLDQAETSKTHPQTASRAVVWLP